MDDATAIEACRIMIKQGKCEGSCEQHEGGIHIYKVAQWGYFAYCEAAKQEDEKRGFILKEIE